MHVSENYSGDPGAVAAARRTTAAYLHRTGPGGGASAEQIENAQLVVSELVTNAVVHTDGPCGLSIGLTADRTVEISVWDTSPRLPTAAPADPSRIGRHGLEIVTVLCGGFRTAHRADGPGKTVTVRLSPAESAA